VACSVSQLAYRRAPPSINRSANRPIFWALQGRTGTGLRMRRVSLMNSCGLALMNICCVGRINIMRVGCIARTLVALNIVNVILRDRVEWRVVWSTSGRGGLIVSSQEAHQVRSTGAGKSRVANWLRRQERGQTIANFTSTSSRPPPSNPLPPHHHRTRPVAHRKHV
jgi:hypothetical protein